MGIESSKNSATNVQGSFETVETPTRQVAQMSPHVAANLQQETTDRPHIFYILIILRDDIIMTRAGLFRLIDAILIIGPVQIRNVNGRVDYSVNPWSEPRIISLMFSNPALRRQVNSPQTNLSDSPCPSISPN